MFNRIIYSLILSVVFFAHTYGQLPGSLDPSFSIDGIEITPLGGANAFGRAMVIQPDGKILVACTGNNGTDTDFAIARFTPEGVLDNSFDEDGIVMIDFDGRTDISEAIALDESNRILIAGSVDSGDGFAFGVARYMPDGSVDESFGDHGFVTRMMGITGFCKAMVIQEDHKIVLGGYVLNELSGTNEYTILRYHDDGTPDSTFHEDGIVMTNMGIGAGVANDMMITPDGKLVLVGQVLDDATFRWHVGVARYNQDGTPDESWDEDGIVFTGSTQADYTIKAVAIQKDDKILVGGFFGTAPSNNVFALLRYEDDGSLDKTFGEEGIVHDTYGAQDNQINTIVVQPDGQILIAGTSLQGNRDLFAVARLDVFGDFDDSFGTNGVSRPQVGQNDGINAMALQQDGKLVVVGESFTGQMFEIAIARFVTGLTTGAEEPARQVINASVFPNPVAELFTVSYQLLQQQPVHIVLSDVHGRIVYTFTNQSMQDAGEYRQVFEIPVGITAGLYWLVVHAGNECRALSFIIGE